MTGEVCTQQMGMKEVINTLKGLVFGSFDRTTPKEREALDKAIKALEAQRWTPVSEKPKTSGLYNCTCYDGVTHRVTTLKWSNGWMLSGRRAYWKVLAWMELPEAYKEGE